MVFCKRNNLPDREQLPMDSSGYLVVKRHLIVVDEPRDILGSGNVEKGCVSGANPYLSADRNPACNPLRHALPGDCQILHCKSQPVMYWEAEAALANFN